MDRISEWLSQPGTSAVRPAQPCLSLPDEDYQLLADLLAIAPERGELVGRRPGRRNAQAGQALVGVTSPTPGSTTARTAPATA